MTFSLYPAIDIREGRCVRLIQGDYDREVKYDADPVDVALSFEEAGASFENIIDVSVFLTDMKKDFKVFNEIYNEYFKELTPTRTTVEVVSLPTPIAVELKIIAFLDEK